MLCPDLNISKKVLPYWDVSCLVAAPAPGTLNSDPEADWAVGLAGADPFLLLCLGAMVANPGQNSQKEQLSQSWLGRH